MFFFYSLFMIDIVYKRYVNIKPSLAHRDIRFVLVSIVDFVMPKIVDVYVEIRLDFYIYE